MSVAGRKVVCLWWRVIRITQWMKQTTLAHPSMARAPIIRTHMWKRLLLGTGSLSCFPSV